MPKDRNYENRKKKQNRAGSNTKSQSSVSKTETRKISPSYANRTDSRANTPSVVRTTSSPSTSTTTRPSYSTTRRTNDKSAGSLRESRNRGTSTGTSTNTSVNRVQPSSGNEMTLQERQARSQSFVNQRTNRTASYTDSGSEQRRTQLKEQSRSKKEPMVHGLNAKILENDRKTRTEKELEKTEARREREEWQRKQKHDLTNLTDSSQFMKADDYLKQADKSDTGTVAGGAALKSVLGYARTLNDIGRPIDEDYDISYGANSWNRTLAEKEKNLLAQRKLREQKTKEREAVIKEMQSATDEEINKAKEGKKGVQKWALDAVESGVGMIGDSFFGPFWGVSMAARTYGSSIDQAMAEGATEEEARNYAAFQSLKEVGTEYMFPGIGLAGRLTGAGTFAKSLSNAGPLKRIPRNLATRYLGGIAEENLEEIAGWGVDPLIKEHTYQRNVRQRQAHDMLNEYGNTLEQALSNGATASSVSAYLGSDDFVKESMDMYKNAGLTDEEAQKAVDRLRDYLSARLSGDLETAAEIEDELSQTIAAGKKLTWEDWDKKELLDTIASTTLLTGVTGAPGAINTKVQGSQIKNDLGKEGIEALGRALLDSENEDTVAQAQAVIDAIAAGKDISDTQAYDLAQAELENNQKLADREQAYGEMFDRVRRQEKLSYPMQMTADGSLTYGEVASSQIERDSLAAKEFLEQQNKEAENIEGARQLTENQIAKTSESIGAFNSGFVTGEDASVVAFNNTEGRAAFEAVTGEDLSQYIVYNKDGSVNVGATNATTYDAFFAKAADNLVQTARAEQANWNDEARGLTKQALSANMEGEGAKAVGMILDQVDPRDQEAYYATGVAARRVYEVGRYTQNEWADVAFDARRAYPEVSPSALRSIFNAAKEDKRIAESAYGQKVDSNTTRSSLKDSAPMYVPGKFTNESQRIVKNSESRILDDVCRQLGINAIMSDELAPGVNGSYSDSTRTIVLNSNNTMGENLNAIFSHEVTHHLAAYATDEYLNLSRYVMDAFYKADPTKFKRDIKRIQDLYMEQQGQELSPEQALEEIIADSSIEFWSNEDFINEITQEKPSFAKSVMNAIKDILGKIRAVLSGGSVRAGEPRDTLYGLINGYDKAYKLWLKAYNAACIDQANAAIDQKQDEMNVRDDDYKYSVAATFARDVDEIADYQGTTQDFEYRHVYMGMTPQFLLDMGFPDLPIGMSSKHLYLVANKSGIFNGKNDNYHNLGKAKLKSLLSDIENPSLVIVSDRYPDRVVVYDGSLDSGKKPIMITISYSDKGRFNDVEIYTNFANTAYGPNRNRFNDMVNAAIKNNGVLLFDNKKSQTLPLSTSGYNTLRSLSSADFNNNITKFRKSVKHKLPTEEEILKAKQTVRQQTIDRMRDKYPTRMGDAFARQAERAISKEMGIPSETYSHRRFSLSEESYNKADKAMPNSILREGQAVNNGENEEGRLVEMYHGSGVPNFTEFNLQDGMLGKGAYFTSAFTEAVDYAKEKLGITETEDGKWLWDGEEYENDELEEALEDGGYVRPFYLNVTDQADVTTSKYGNGDVVAVIRNKGDAKSSSPITIDDNGDVIPVEQRFDLDNPDVRYSLNPQDANGKALTDDQKEFYGNVAPELKDENGNIKRYYHGTARADRVGYVFDPARATSGPMAFFTDNPEIAANYARDKRDTSLAYDGIDRDNYYNQFVVEVDGEEMNLLDYWNTLTPAEKNKYSKLAGEIGWDDEADQFEIHEGATNGNGGYGNDPLTVRQARGNVFRMLEDAWLWSGDLFNEEERFLDILKMMGIENAKYLDPDFRDEKVFEVYLNVTNPIVTTNIDSEFAEDLEDWLDATDLDYYKKESMDADMWDKNSIDPYDWLERLQDDIENGTTHAWTSIPDAITAFLQEQGYDGIVDQGGKFHEAGHQVVIPFASEQVKDIDNEHPTASTDRRYSLSPSVIMRTLEDNFNEYKEDNTNLRIAAGALADLQRLHDSAGGSYLEDGRRRLDDEPNAFTEQDGRVSSDRRPSYISAAGSYRTLAKGISTSLVNEGYIDFIGKRVESPEDLAKLCQVLRDPRFETTRLILTKKNKIVSFQSTTSRLPGVSRIHGEASNHMHFIKVFQQMQEMGADGFYLLHNHPSGNVEASNPDLSVTSQYINALGADKFKGHIILDHDKYGFIDSSLTSTEKMIEGQQTIDFIHEPEIDHNYLGTKISNTTILANIARDLNTSSDCSVLIYSANGGAGIQGIQEISNEMLADTEAMQEFIRESAVDFGAPNVFLYTKTSEDDLEAMDTINTLFNNSTFVDVIQSDMSFMAIGRQKYGDPAMLGLTEEDFANRTSVYESMSGAENYDSLRYSITPKMDADYMDAVNNNDMETAARLVEEAATGAGFTERVFHGTKSQVPFYKFKKPSENYSTYSTGSGFIYSSPSYDYAYNYSLEQDEEVDWYAEEGSVMEGYVNPNNKLDVGNVDEFVFKGVPFKSKDGDTLYDSTWPDYNDKAEINKRAADGLRRIAKLMDSDPYDFIHKFGEPLYHEIENGMMSVFDYVNQPLFAEFVKEQGYDGIKLEEWGEDAFGVLDSSQFKSADTIAYADDGSVIPLSERFNPENDDIRYSLPTQDADGNILADGQMEYFKNSQARDKEGRLVRVFHTTNRGGFTIFDPSYSDDKRSIFFASNYEVSQSYGRGASKRVNLEAAENQEEWRPYTSFDDLLTRIEGEEGWRFQVLDMGPNATAGERKEYTLDDFLENEKSGAKEQLLLRVQIPSGEWAQGYRWRDVLKEINIWQEKTYGQQRGYYECYLNLENPLVVECNYSNWNKIEFGEDSFNPVRQATLDRMRDEASKIVDNIEIAWEMWDEELESNTELRVFISGKERDDHGEWVEWERDELLTLSGREDDIEDADNPSAVLVEALYDMWTEEWELGSDYYDEIMNLVDNNGDIFYTPEKANQEHASDYIDGDGNRIDYAEIFDEIDVSGEFAEPGRYAPYTGLNRRRYTTRELAEIAQSKGHDGVIFRDLMDQGPFGGLNYDTYSDIYVAFSSNQIKDVNNLNPTENPDIRYSIVPEDEALSKIAYDDAMDDSYEALDYYEKLITEVDPETYNIRPFDEERVSAFYAALNQTEAVVTGDPVQEEDRVRMAKSKQDFFNSLNAKWNDRWVSDGQVLDVKYVKTDIRNLVMGVMANSDTDAKFRHELVNKMLMDVRTAYQLMKQDRQDVASSLLYHSALRMIEGAEFYVDDGYYDRYLEIKDYFKNTRIALGEEYWSDVDFGAFRRNNFGRMKLVKGSTNVDQIYQELSEIFPEYFNEDEIMSVPDQLEQMAHVLDIVQPYKEAYTSEAAAELAFDIADELYDIMVGGKEVRSLADQYKERYDAKTKAMKQRHQEAMQKVKERSEAGIRAERAKWQVKEEKRKERAAHKKAFGSIEANYKWLTDRLLSNTADKHIPEHYKKDLAKMLSAFDLQTVTSKKIENRRGYKARKTIQMSALRSGLQAMHKAYDTFYVHDTITDMIDDLAKNVDGKTIDELSIAELQAVDTILKGIKHEFINYDKIRVAGKKSEVEAIGKNQVDAALKHAELFGAGKDYQNAPGWIDRIINLDEVTPAYMFRRIDPNNEGLGVMWKEIRRSFDKYVRNQSQLNDWMEEIVGKYHSKGILWNKYGAGELTNWRSENYAQAFTLEGGTTIQLTPAQMMSLYCLSKRNQAYQHMVGAGIVISPVTFQAKIISDLKKKANTALPVSLTDADIKQITSKLTPDQLRVADQIQELMSTKMAEWGNEASMDVLGIKLFNEKDYFPIKSDKAALTRDLNENEFVEAIRNFGFTKAVAPGARNAIMIDDIFDVVTEHCNNMNLYNSYSASINDFMKVYNYRDFREDGSEYTVQQAISHAHSRKANTFIMTFMKDLNGNVSGRASGIENMYTGMLANAKKASVFANFRVAAQQPTALTRAFAVISPKYLKGIKIEQGAMKEMFEHCPIALWKSWGYYDINMGKSIEDIMMNNGRWLEDKATDLYGALDNVTWTAIYQMVKAEAKDTHPELKEGTDEYWEHINDRFSEIIDLTQVVDSPMHRSHGMRDRGFFQKMVTSFMAEPTLTFNMIKSGYIEAKEQYMLGNKKEAAKIASRTLSVAVLQAATVASFAAFVDALRNKNPDKDDEDDRFLHLWWINTIENFKDELKIWNKIYVVKDIASIMEGWDNSNLALQGVQKFSLGVRQYLGDPYARSSVSWYANIADGLGYMFGVPVKTIRTGISNVMKRFGVTSPILTEIGDSLDEKAKENKEKRKAAEEIEESGFFGKLLAKTDTGEGEEETSESSIKKEDLPDNMTDEQKEEIIKAGERRQKANAEKSESSDGSVGVAHRDKNAMRFDAEKAAAGYEGEERNKKIWQSVSQGYKDHVMEGDFAYIAKMRAVVADMGGDLNYFDSQVMETAKTAMKKTIEPGGADTEAEMVAQQNIKEYILNHGGTDAELSEMVYKSATAKDLKVAFRINDEMAIRSTAQALVWAGITQEDMDRLYKNRNRMDLKKYNGKYKSRLKSTGKFVWPAQGTITSGFGYRDAPTAGASSYHQAVDIGAPTGTPVVAADGGVVITAGWNGGYGYSVGIKHDDGTVTYYNHLNNFSVKVGDAVSQGQDIAQVGSTGVSTGPHLDFKVLDANGKAVDPMKYLQEKQS